MIPAERDEVGLDIALKKMVDRLNRVDVTDAAAPPQQGDVKVGDADEANLPRFYQAVHRPHALLDRRLRVAPMALVQVDIVGPKALQAGVAST